MNSTSGPSNKISQINPINNSNVSGHDQFYKYLNSFPKFLLLHFPLKLCKFPGFLLFSPLSFFFLSLPFGFLFRFTLKSINMFSLFLTVFSTEIIFTFLFVFYLLLQISNIVIEKEHNPSIFFL